MKFNVAYKTENRKFAHVLDQIKVEEADCLKTIVDRWAWVSGEYFTDEDMYSDTQSCTETKYISDKEAIVYLKTRHGSEGTFLDATVTITVIE